MSNLRLIVILFAGITVLFSITGCGDKGYEITRDQVYWKSWDEGRGSRKFKVIGADAETFEVLKFTLGIKTSQFARDKRQVYLRGVPIPNANSATFKQIRATKYYKDVNRIYINVGGRILSIDGAEPDSFRIVQDEWSRDAKRYFLENKGIEPRDIDSFEILNPNKWARDKEAYYICIDHWRYGIQEVIGADRETFKIIEEHESTFSRDKDYLYWLGRRVDECDVETFVVDDIVRGHDNDFNYRFIRKDIGQGKAWKLIIQKSKISS